MKDLKFLYCEKCKKVLLTLKDTRVPTMCCGQPMTVLEPNTSGAAVEKHVPVPEVKDGKILVKVGEAAHPMTREHLIQLVAVLFDDGSFAVKELSPDSLPKAEFALGEAKPVAVYAWCNLHGLWKREI